MGLKSGVTVVFARMARGKRKHHVDAAASKRNARVDADLLTGLIAEVQLYMLSFLDMQSVLVYSEVCKALFKIVDSRYAWPLKAYPPTFNDFSLSKRQKYIQQYILANPLCPSEAQSEIAILTSTGWVLSVIHEDIECSSDPREFLQTEAYALFTEEGHVTASRIRCCTDFSTVGYKELGTCHADESTVMLLRMGKDYYWDSWNARKIHTVYLYECFAGIAVGDATTLLLDQALAKDRPGGTAFIAVRDGVPVTAIRCGTDTIMGDKICCFLGCVAYEAKKVPEVLSASSIICWPGEQEVDSRLKRYQQTEDFIKRHRLGGIYHKVREAITKYKEHCMVLREIRDLLP